MPYKVGEKGSYGCSGYPAVKDDGTVMGCHKTKEAAAAQIYAINQSEGNIPDKGIGIKDPQEWPKTNKSEHGIKEGDYVMGETSEGIVHGRVEHIMWEGGILGSPEGEYALESMPPENPAMSVRIFEETDEGVWEETAYSIGMMYEDARVLEDLEGHTMPEGGNPNMEAVYALAKAETYSPNSGMKAAARRAIKWKEDGKAKGAGTPVGWGRARDIVAGRSMSLSVVKRMYSFFSRHEVDKKGKGFYSGPDFPSKGRVMWDAWGGDAGFSWSRAIVKRNEDKAMFADFGKDWTKAESLSEVFKSMHEDEEKPKEEYEEHKAESVRIGQMVSWNSSGGRASGKVKRVIRSGSYNVPGTDVTINASEDNPAVVIELESGQIVAHRMSTLRAL